MMSEVWEQRHGNRLAFELRARVERLFWPEMAEGGVGELLKTLSARAAEWEAYRASPQYEIDHPPPSAGEDMMPMEDATEGHLSQMRAPHP